MVIFLDKLSNFLDKVVRNILFVLVFVILCTTGVQIFSRYFLNISFFWSEEIVRYIFIWIVYLGTSCALKEGSQISVDIFEKWLIRKNNAPFLGIVFIYIRYLIITITLFIVGYFSLKIIVVNIGVKSIAINLSMSIPYLCIPISFLISLIHVLNEFFISSAKNEKLVKLER